MKPDWWDLPALVGAGAFAYGLWMVYAPLAWLFGGAALIWVGINGHRGKSV